MNDNTIDKPISLLLGIYLGLDQKPIDPQSVGLFKTPVMPSLRIIKNPLDNKLCFTGKLGGRYTDYQHPIKEFRRKVLISRKAKKMLESNTLKRTRVPKVAIIKVLAQHIHLYHCQSEEMMKFLE